MKKKRLIILLSILLVLVVIVVLSSTVFTLKTVVVNFYDYYDNMVDDITKNEYFNSSEKVDAVIESGEFKYGKNIFLLNKDSYKKNLEKNNPYIKVISMNIEFPNRMVVKAIERREYYAVLNENNTYFVCDAEFKVLRIADTKPTGLIEVVGSGASTIFDYVNTSAELNSGDFISLSDNTKVLLTFADEMYACHYEREKMLNRVSAISLKNELCSNQSLGKVDTLVIKTNAGVEIEIENINNNFADKVLKALEIYNGIENSSNPGNTSRGVIKVLDNLSGSWSE